MTEDRQSWNVEKMNEGTKGLWVIGWWESGQSGGHKGTGVGRVLGRWVGWVSRRALCVVL